MGAETVLALQRQVGNAAVGQLLLRQSDDQASPAPADDDRRPAVSSLAEEFVPAVFSEISYQHVDPVSLGQESGDSGSETGPSAPRSRLIDAGRVGTGRYGDPDDAPPLAPRAFTNGGQTGTVVWAGGGGAGAHGNEPAASIQAQIPPIYQAAAGPDGGGLGAGAPHLPFDGWVRAGTGMIAVMRSWVGTNAGNQGNGQWVSPAAAARLNLHETLHVNSTQTIYNANLAPLETRIASFRPGQPATQNIGTSAADAQAKVQAAVNWAGAISAFQAADQAANAPGGTTDTNDLASGTYPVDAGPGTVAGVSFLHRVRLPSEPNPAP